MNGLVGRRSLQPVWTLGDQVVWSISNAALVALLARAEVSLAASAIVVLTIQLVSSLVRAAIGEVLVAQHGHKSEEDFRLVWSRSIGLAAVAATVSAFLVFGLAIAGAAPARLGIVGALAGVPVVVHEVSRLALMSAQRAGVALVADSLWLFVSLGFWSVADVRSSAVLLIAAWSAGALSALALGLVVPRVRPSFELTTIFSMLGHSRAVLLEDVLFRGSSQVGLLAAGAVLPTTVLAGVLGGRTLLGPSGVVAAAGQAYGFGLMSRCPELRRRRLMLLTSGTLVLGVLANFAVIVAFESELARVLGDPDDWAAIAAVLPVLVLSALVHQLGVGPLLLTRVQAVYAEVRKIRLRSAPLYLALPLVLGTVFNSSAAVVFGLVVPGCIGTALMWNLSLSLTRFGQGLNG